MIYYTDALAIVSNIISKIVRQANSQIDILNIYVQDLTYCFETADMSVLISSRSQRQREKLRRVGLEERGQTKRGSFELGSNCNFRAGFSSGTDIHTSEFNTQYPISSG